VFVVYFSIIHGIITHTNDNGRLVFSSADASPPLNLLSRAQLKKLGQSAKCQNLFSCLGIQNKKSIAPMSESKAFSTYLQLAAICI
jgi:hypothetical protein